MHTTFDGGNSLFLLASEIPIYKESFLAVSLLCLGFSVLYQMKNKYNFEYRIQRNAIVAFLFTEISTLLMYGLDNKSIFLKKWGPIETYHSLA